MNFSYLFEPHVSRIFFEFIEHLLIPAYKVFTADKTIGGLIRCSTNRLLRQTDVLAKFRQAVTLQTLICPSNLPESHF